MNSTKLFNFKYLKQNLKKSKGLLTILVLIIPVLTTLMLISVNSSEYDVVVETEEYNFINYFGMYIFPFVVSVILTGYVYKRNSVDFINSMPISRKTIYFTNFIGGILLIFLTQILTLISSLICSVMLKDMFLPIGLILDSFTVMTISYIFTYSATMLALTLSGNVLTQVVVTALILFVVPFVHCSFVNSGIVAEKNINLNYNSGTSTIIETRIPEYTMPFNVVSTLFYGSDYTFFNVNSMIKMAVLTVVYCILGAILFNKRKMENNLTSFASYKSHYLVKALTMLPMVFFANIAGTEGVYIAIVIVLMFIYYVLYDFVLNKKVQLKYTLPIFVVTILALQGFYKLGVEIQSRVPEQNISANEIAGIAVSNNSMDYATTTKGNRSLDVLIDEKDMIEKIISNVLDRQYYIDSWSADFKALHYSVIRIKLNNGKDIYAYVYIDENVYNEIMNFINTNEKYSAQKPENYDFKELAISCRNELLPAELTERLTRILAKNNYKVSDTSELPSSAFTEIYVYDRHSMHTARISLNIDEEVFEIISQYFNKQTYESLVNGDFNIEDSDANVKVMNCVKNGWKEKNSYIEHLDTETIEYMKNHYQDKCDYNQELVEIYMYGKNDITFFTNVNEEINKILDRLNFDGYMTPEEIINEDITELDAVPVQ